MSEAAYTDVLNDGISRVSLLSHSGGDESVVRAARISHGKTVTDPERDKKLIAYMLLHHHGTPFEHNLFTFRIKAPIFVFRQWHRTRIGVSFNEVSARYTEMKDEFYIPKVWRMQDTKNKQGSVGFEVFDHDSFSRGLEAECARSMHVYKEMIRVGIAREMARMVLPVNLYSDMWFSCNARSLMNFIELRSEDHAQAETRLYSDALAECLKQCMPWTYEAFASRLDPDKYRGLKLAEVA